MPAVAAGASASGAESARVQGALARFRQLEADCAAARGEFDAWAAKQLTEVEGDKKAHVRRVHDANAAIQNLRERETALQGKAAGLAREAGQQQALEQRLVTELGAARAQEAALPRKIEVLRSEVEARLAKAAEGERAAQDARAVRQGKLDAVRNCVALYGQRLGLRFEYEEADTLKLVFTLIDPKDHAREFSFALHVHDDNTYSLRDCSPPVEGAAQLLADLTGDNNFAGFVRTMRAKFVEMARGVQ